MNLITTRSKTLLFAAMLVCAATQSVHADFYLNGGIATRISANGASFGAPAEFDSFNTVNDPLLFNNATETSQLLSMGTQSFSVTGHVVAEYRGLALFFTPTATQLSPTTHFNRAPDLYVYTNGSTFQFGAAGTDVVTLGAFSEPPYAAYSGATSFSIGLETVTVSGWDGNTLTLTLTAVPEPSSLALISITLFGISFRRSKRSKAHLVD